MPASSETFNFTVNGTDVAQLTHPGDSTTEIRTANKLKGDGYYGRADGFHTVQYNVTGFIGKIVVQATLAVDPASTDWFTLDNTEHASADDSSTNADGSFIVNFTGNYVWIRIYVYDWTDGTINSIILNH
jgi:hypothetical protein|tara:strand:+ start:4342 stop:4731 length:390 start_codon:yes stop_codon:yes gene_type:complete